MIKGNIYKQKINSKIVVLVTWVYENSEYFDAVVVSSNNPKEVGYYASGWNANDFEEYIGQLDLNNIFVNNRVIKIDKN